MCDKADKTKLKFFVGGIPSDVKHKDLYEYFGVFGSVKRVTIFNQDSGRKLFGFCFIRFKRLYGNQLCDKNYVFSFRGRNLDVDPIFKRSSLKSTVKEKHDKRIFI